MAPLHCTLLLSKAGLKLFACFAGLAQRKTWRRSLASLSCVLLPIGAVLKSFIAMLIQIKQAITDDATPLYFGSQQGYLAK